MIQLSKVKKSYQIGKETFDVLRSIDLTIEEGEYVSIMGPSGSGKSTIMNIIGCLDRPTSGSYRTKNIKRLLADLIAFFHL